MTRIVAVLAAGIALSSCDSFGEAPFTPSDPSTLIGSWDAQPSSRELHVTPSVEIDVPDFSRTQGALSARGAVTADFRTVTFARGYSTRPQLSVTAYPNGEYLGAPYVSLEATGGQLRMIVTGGNVPIYFRGGETDEAPAFSYADGVLTLTPATLRGDDGAEVRVGGALTVATTRVPAGLEYLLDSTGGIVRENDDEEWVFKDDGVLERRIEYGTVLGTRTRVKEAGWEILGPERIALTLQEDQPQVYALEGSDNEARLIEDPISYNDEGLRSVEATFFLPPRSLSKARLQEVFTLKR